MQCKRISVSTFTYQINIKEKQSMKIISSILSGTNANTPLMVSHLSRLVADQIPVKALHSTPTEVESGVLVLNGSVSDDGSGLCSCELPSDDRDCSLFPLFLCQVAFHLVNSKEFCLIVIPGSSLDCHRRCALTQPKAAIIIPAVDIKSFEEPYINSECCSSKFSKKPKIRRGIPKNHAFRGASLCFCIAKTGLYGAPYWLTVSSLQGTNRQSPIDKLGIPCRMVPGYLHTLVRNYVHGLGCFAFPFPLYYLTNQGNPFHSLS